MDTFPTTEPKASTD